MKKTVLITGASRGIGAQTARLFARQNYNVVINFHNSEERAHALERELKIIGADVFAIKADVSNCEQVINMVNDATKKYGKIDVLVNNAGISSQKLFTDITTADWNLMFDVNVRGVFNCCKAVLPDMIRHKEGKIINISSMWGLVGASCEVHYSAAKAAVIGLTKALAKEVAPSNIHVNCVAPGVIDTDMNSGLSQADIDVLKEETPLGKIGTTEDIANMILFLASEKSNFITGQIISANGGIVI